ncbi:amidase [Zavarzinia sp. CC-PAN008]|uniref:amidase n=1 Tax=Zavarzinia sp. CC-PAN008 TaxID=3243332 RepID=UPI003F742159
MADADLHFSSASALAALVAARKVSARELLDHFAARVERHNPALNAVVALDLDRARASADAADADLARGRSHGPLHGLPITIKDAYEVAGVVSTGGSPDYAAHVPQADAVAVARLKAAGAIVFGKTNVPFLSADFQTYNPVYGTTNNPWDVRCGPGGSSGGSAASVAAGLTAFEYGSDIGGSIRTPAHLCGVFGHKATFGIVPKHGHIPPPPGTHSQADLSVLGPLARSAGDLDLLLAATAGPEAAAAKGLSLNLPAPRATTPKGLRVAVWLDDPHCEIDSESVALIERAAAELEKAGATVDHAARPDFTLAESTEIYLTLLHATVAARFPEPVRQKWIELKQRLPATDMSHRALQARGATISHADWLTMHERREGLRAKWARFFEGVDVVLAPVIPRPAFPHDQQSDFHARRLDVNGVQREYLDALIWAGPAVAAYLPASVAPVGLTRAGLPVGVQIIGPYLEDRTTIAVAGMIEQLLGGFVAPPDFR